MNTMNTMNINEYEKVTAIISLTKRNGEILAFKELGDKCLSLQPLPDAILEYTNKVTMGVVKPKYDPCRKFREGDIVTPKERNGRLPWGKDTKLKVVADERMAGVTVRDEETGKERFICALFLELVTPVEELEPYIVRESDAFDIVREGKIVMTIPFTEDDYYTFEQAKAAAEAERDRLNAEYRKEMEK